MPDQKMARQLSRVGIRCYKSMLSSPPREEHLERRQKFGNHCQITVAKECSQLRSLVQFGKSLRKHDSTVYYKASKELVTKRISQRGHRTIIEGVYEYTQTTTTRTRKKYDLPNIHADTYVTRTVRTIFIFRVVRSVFIIIFYYVIFSMISSFWINIYYARSWVISNFIKRWQNISISNQT